MGINISLQIDEENIKANIRLANHCPFCIKDDHEKSIEVQDCEYCDNKRIRLTDNGKKILGLMQQFLGRTDLLDLKDLTDREKRYNW